MAAGIQAVQQVGQAGKIIVLHLEAADDKDIKVTADGADPAAPGSSRSLYKNVEYKLAIYLVCAGRYPEAKTLSPRHGDDQVSPGDFQCRIEFDRAIKKGTGAISLFRMKDRQKLTSVPVESDAVTCPDDKTVVIKLPVGLEMKTQYSLVVEKGAFCDQANLKFLATPVLGV